MPEWTSHLRPRLALLRACVRSAYGGRSVLPRATCYASSPEVGFA